MKYKDVLKKKVFLVLLLGLFFSLGVVSAKDFVIRNESNGASYLVVNGSTGYVGIGVNNPTVELDVLGSGSFTGTIDAVTLNTGQGDYELYEMDQDLLTSSSPDFLGVDIVAGDDNGIRFWNGVDNYKISMGNDQPNHGTVTDYSMHYAMGTTAGRGFTFGSSDTAVSASIVALTGDIHTDGNITSEGRFISSRYGYAGTYNSNQVQGVWSIGEAYQIDTVADDFGTQYGMGYAYSTNGGAPFANEHQIVFTNNGVIGAAIGLSGSAYFAGDVGIGITNAGEKLEVDGNINVTTGNDVCIDGGVCLSSLSIPTCNDLEGLVYNQTSLAWECGSSGDNVDIGTVQAFAMDTCPEYWLEANGSSISTSTYSELYSAIGTVYGSGSGVFSLPDYRGYFLRGWDNSSGNDPDAALRLDSGGSVTGDEVGTKQDYSTVLPNNDFVTDDPGSHTHPSGALGGTSYNGGEAIGSSASVALDGLPNSFWTGNGGAHSHNITSGGDNETRPGNINVLYCIRALPGDSFEDADTGNFTISSVGGSVIIQF